MGVNKLKQAKQPHELNLVKNHDLHVKLSESQKKKIAENSLAAGFKSLSDFVRHTAMEEGYTMGQRVREIHAAILGQKSQIKHQTTHRPYNPYHDSVPKNYALGP